MKAVVFWEKEFPFIDTAPLTQQQIKKALGGWQVSFAGLADLQRDLANADLLLTVHGSAVAKAAWPAFMEFFSRGGNWAHLGGAPFTRPVRLSGGAWHIETHQTCFAREVMLRHTFEVPLPATARLVSLQEHADLSSALSGFEPTRAWALQIRLTDNRVHHEDAGSSGTRQAYFTPLVHAIDEGKVLVAPIAALDHPLGPYCGGRWVLAPCQGQEPLSAKLIKAMCEHAVGPHVRLEVRPGFGCYYPGEKATMIIRAACSTQTELTVKLSIRDDRGKQVYSGRFDTTAGAADAFITTPPITVPRAGLYSASSQAFAKGKLVAGAHNGFWVYDAKLMAKPKPLSMNKDYFLRDGKPYPVTGTTYFSTVSHRSFLFEPTPLDWDRDMAAMKKCGINMIRTGVWTGWLRATQDVGAVDEAVVRSLQAYVLTAAKHDIPVIFNCFAFIPNSWNAVNPYIDPAALAAQKAFVSALSRRLVEANHLMWDFINEPSFFNANALFAVHPNYDSVEASAWRQWLRERGYSDDELRERWRISPNEHMGPPKPEDFFEHHTLQGIEPMRTIDFVLFGQEMFARWAKAMADVIRANGNPNQFVTVGQDEQGCYRSPTPHFYRGSVDFTSNHTWWQNDDLLWDSVVTKTPHRPHLVEETGVMFAETLDALPARTLEQVRDLLERKLVLAFAGGCGGFIQWLWNTWTYNYTDMEAGIGMLRADGSAKPELWALSDVAHFMAGVGRYMVGRRSEETCIVIPHSNQFGTCPTADAALRRSVRTLEYRMGVPCRSASEYFPQDIGNARFIVLPAPRQLIQECWDVLMEKVRRGAWLLASGFIEADEVRRPVPRLARWGLQTVCRTMLHQETLPLAKELGQDALEVCFAPQHGTIPHLQTARGPGEQALPLQVLPLGKGKIVYCPIPIENCLSEADTENVYRLFAKAAGLQTNKPQATAPGLLVRPERFEKHTLFLIVNESSVPQQATLSGQAVRAGDWRHVVAVPAGRSAMVLVENAGGKIIAQYQPRE